MLDLSRSDPYKQNLYFKIRFASYKYNFTPMLKINIHGATAITCTTVIQKQHRDL